nr:hypothetical protein [Tanacetum cinerariifolium]
MINIIFKPTIKHDRKVTAEKERKKKTASAKQPKSKPTIEKSSKPAPAPKPKATKERPSKASTAKPPKPNLAKEKSTKTTQPQKAVKGEGDEDDMERAIQMSLESFEVQSQSHVGGVAIREPVAVAIQPLPVVEGKGKAIVTEEQAAHSLLALHTPKRRSTTDQFIFQRQTSAIEASSTGPSAQAQDDTSFNIICDSPSPVDAEIGITSEKTNSGVMDEDQAGPDPGESHGALARPDPEPTHDEFMADLYPKVQEILKFLVDEHVILEDPISLTETLSSMKNLEDAYAIGDQFINDKSTEDKPKKPNVEAEVVSMVTILIYQASFLVPPPSIPIPVIDLSPPKPASSTTQAPIFTVTTTTTTTTLPPPPQQQSTTEPELAVRVTSLEKKLSDLEQKNKTLDNTFQNLGFRVFTLELRDLPHKIDEVVRESVRERMFETDTYKSLPEHVTLYEALEAFMERANKDELLTEMDKSCKRRRDDQDPPPPSLDSDLSKKRRHDTGASGSLQPQAPQSSAWKKYDTRDAPPSSFKKQSGPHAEKPVEDIPMPDIANRSDIEDTNSAHLLKIKQRPERLKPIPDDERPTTPEPSWVIPTSHIPDMEECHKMLIDHIDWANPEGDQVRIDISKPLPLSGPPSHVTIQTQFFFNHNLDYSRYGSKGSGHALSISKMKAARYLDFGLELLVPEHMWINEVCTYDISASYGVCHWWFNHQKFYIDRHIAESSRKVVRSHMRILSVVSIKAYSRYGSDKRMLSTAVKLWTHNLVIRQLVEDFQLSIKSYQKQLNLTKSRWDAKGFEYKHDYTIIDSPRAVVFPVDNNKRKI